jgi:hypothetical protein
MLLLAKRISKDSEVLWSVSVQYEQLGKRCCSPAQGSASDVVWSLSRTKVDGVARRLMHKTDWQHENEAKARGRGMVVVFNCLDKTQAAQMKSCYPIPELDSHSCRMT